VKCTRIIYISYHEGLHWVRRKCSVKVVVGATSLLRSCSNSELDLNEPVETSLAKGIDDKSETVNTNPNERQGLSRQQGTVVSHFTNLERRCIKLLNGKNN